MTDQQKIDDLTHLFFSLFTNTNGQDPPIHKFLDLFIAEGLLISNTMGQTAVFSVAEFHQSRKTMLTDGTLTQFQEWETSQTTTILGHIAHRECAYEKSGILNGVPFSSSGRKSIQFIKSDDEWKMSIASWCDDPMAG